jgi:Zn-dependent metalloprotease
MAIGKPRDIEPPYTLAFSLKADREWRLVNLKQDINQTKYQWNREIYDCKRTNKKQYILVRAEGQLPVKDEDVNYAYDYVGIVLDYLYEHFKWKSLDNNGIPVIVNVHYLEKYNNSFWDGEQICVGDGDETNFNGFASLSVLAYTLFKGVIQYSAGFIYKGQSGAIYESYSDVISSAIKQYYRKELAENANWLIGEDITVGKFNGKCLRSLKEPDNAKLVIAPQPKHVSDLYKGTSDNGGVHINSGILNHAFYLVSMQIGTQQAALLWFEALKTMKPNAKFVDLYKALKQVAPDLIAKDSIPQNTLEVLLEAFTQVGILEQDKKRKPIVKK